MNEQNKHTTGPWRARAGAVFSGSEGSPCFIARTAHPSREIGLCIRSVEERWHNARLIAAAPALLEALRGLLNAAWQDTETLDAAIQQARAALALIDDTPNA